MKWFLADGNIQARSPFGTIGYGGGIRRIAEGSKNDGNSAAGWMAAHELSEFSTGLALCAKWLYGFFLFKSDGPEKGGDSRFSADGKNIRPRRGRRPDPENEGGGKILLPLRVELTPEPGGAFWWFSVRSCP